MNKSSQDNSPINIVQNGDPVLRELAQSVPIKDIQSAKIRGIIEKMKIALRSQNDGVAIAAPQIGVPLRIFVVSGIVLRTALENQTRDPETKRLKITKSDKSVSSKNSITGDASDSTSDMVFINPVITKLSRTKESMDEGCLSVRWLYGKVKRSTKASIRAYNERGEVFERGATGLLAQVFQHETDHLDGILFIDKATEIEDMPPEKQVD